MTAEFNKAMMQNLFETMLQGNRDSYQDALHDNVVFQVMGASTWSQTVRGKARILVDYFGYVSSRLSTRRPTRPLRILADDDWVLVEAKGDMVAIDGRPYQNDYCLHYRIADGKIVEIKEYMDTVLCEDRLGPFPDELKRRLQDG